MTKPTPAPPVSAGADQSTRLEAFLDQHARKVVVVLLVLALLIALLVTRHLLGVQHETRAGEALVAAQDNAALRAVAEDFAGTTAAGSALLLLADRQQDAGDHSGAEATLRRFLDEFPRHTLMPQARLALAAALLAQDRREEAMAESETVLSRHRSSPMAALALVFQGEVLEGEGRVEEARARYEQVTLDFPESSFLGLATMMSERAGFIPPVEVDPPPVEDPLPDDSFLTDPLDLLVPPVSAGLPPGISISLDDEDAPVPDEAPDEDGPESAPAGDEEIPEAGAEEEEDEEDAADVPDDEV